MKTFMGWREAGHAMRWARRQTGVTVARRQYWASTDNRWQEGDTAVTVTHITGGLGVSVGVDMPGAEAELVGHDAQQVLDVLAALRLIPAEYCSAYRTGHAHGRMDAAGEIVEARRTYDVIVNAGKNAYRGGEQRG